MNNPYPPSPQSPWGPQNPQQPYPQQPYPQQGGHQAAPNPYPPAGYPGASNPYPQGGYAPPGQQPYPQQGGHPAQQNPQQHPQQQYAPQGTGQAHLVLDLKHFPLAWIFMFIKPKIVINGHMMTGQWGRNVLPMPAGQHHVHVHVPYMIPSQVGPATLQVPLQPGQTLELEYRAPVFVFSPGSMGQGEQPWPGMGPGIALAVGPFVLLLLVFMLSVLAG